MIPGPDERLRERLAHMPDACRALLAAMDRAQARQGGWVTVRFEVSPSGEVEALVVEARYDARQAT